MLRRHQGVSAAGALSRNPAPAGNAASLSPAPHPALRDDPERPARRVEGLPLPVGQPGCPQCDGEGFVPAVGSLVRICPCTGQNLNGLVPRPKPTLVSTDWSPERLAQIRQLYSDALRTGRAPTGEQLHPDDKPFLEALKNAWGEDAIVPVRELAERTQIAEGQSAENRRRVFHKCAERIRMSYGFVQRGLILGAYSNYVKRTADSPTELRLHGYFWVMTLDELHRAFHRLWRQACCELRLLRTVFPHRNEMSAAEASLAGQFEIVFGHSPYDPGGEFKSKKPQGT